MQSLALLDRLICLVCLPSSHPAALLIRASLLLHPSCCQHTTSPLPWIFPPSPCFGICGSQLPFLNSCFPWPPLREAGLHSLWRDCQTNISQKLAEESVYSLKETLLKGHHVQGYWALKLLKWGEGDACVVQTHPSLNLNPTLQLGLWAEMAHPELRQWQHLGKSMFVAFACILCSRLPGCVVTSGIFSLCLSVSAAAYLFIQTVAGKASNPSLSWQKSDTMSDPPCWSTDRFGAWSGQIKLTRAFHSLKKVCLPSFFSQPCTYTPTSNTWKRKICLCLVC